MVRIVEGIEKIFMKRVNILEARKSVKNDLKLLAERF